MSARAVAIIPARLGSTRFPAKALADETGKPLVVHVCEQASKAKSLDRVVVATDSKEIRIAVESHGFEAVMTSIDHENGTSRLAEASEVLALDDNQLIVNVQGDEPEIEPDVIDAAAAAGGMIDTIGAGTVVTLIYTDEEFRDPNIVKAVLGAQRGDARSAMYFSRATVPFPRISPSDPPFRHVGIYAYTVASIRAYLDLAPSATEQTESLEQLRWLAHGYPILASVVESAHSGIDTPEQYRAFVERHQQKMT
ncbi:MAG: 3-deoxy-manno-octulosonate cytidylyltransferase [Phycisphaerales bacterium]